MILIEADAVAILFEEEVHILPRPLGPFPELLSIVLEMFVICGDKIGFNFVGERLKWIPKLTTIYCI